MTKAITTKAITTKAITTTTLKCIGVGVALALGSACGGGGGGTSPAGGTPTNPGSQGPVSPPVSGPADNLPPVIAGEPAESILAGTTYDFTPTATDPNNDQLTFGADNLPDWLQLDVANGGVFGSPGLSELGVYRNIVIWADDGTARSALAPFDIEVTAPAFSADNFIPSGNVVDTADGYTVEGELAFEFGGRRQAIENASLAITLGAEGDLLDIAGEGTLPRQFDEMVRLDAGVSMTVGLFDGLMINQDDRFDVNMLESRQYMLYFLDYGITLEIDNPEFPGQKLTVSSPDIPGIPSFLMIADPYDPMYYYGDGEDFGWAFSVQGLLPFVPTLDHPLITPFEGHHYYKGTIPFGFKVFDFFSFTGESIVHDPLAAPMVQTSFFTDGQAQWNAKANAGFNGAFKFDFSIGPVGLFTFDIGAATAAFEFSRDDQYFVMQGLMEPDVSWAPDWMPFIPETSLSAELTHEIVAGVPSVNASLSGAFRSTVPRADVEGSVHFTMDSVALEGIVRDEVDIPVSITFSENETVARVGLDVDFSEQVSEQVDATFDTAQAEVDEATTALQDSLAEFDRAVSLNGLRSELPSIMDTAISRLNAVPESVRSSVYSSTVSGINARRVCGLGTCTPSDSTRNSLATTAANAARDDARAEVAIEVAAMNNLKVRAAQEDEAVLRDALEDALRTAYAKRRFSDTFSGSVSFSVLGTPYTVTRSKSVNITVIDSPLDADILQAANNVQDIDATETVVISTQEIFDSLPAQEVLDAAREEARQELTEFASIDSVGYTVVSGAYSAFIELSSGKRYDVGFNVLSFEEAAAGIAELLTQGIAGE